jgi:prepilin-type N-terminal cleavage/methylation domain-containing protein
MKKRGGFTLVELVVVIVAVGILTGLAIIGITRYQADTRDAQRSANINTVSNALEKYFTENGNYPSCQAISSNTDTLTSTVLKGLDKSALQMPDAAKNETKPIRCGQTLALAGEEFIEYQGDGSSSCIGSGSCSSYKLIYRNELDSSLSEVVSRGLVTGNTPSPVQAPTPTPNTDTAKLGTPTLSATANSPTQITINWTPAANSDASTTHTLVRATNSTFTTGVVNTKGITTTSSIASDLATGKAYYFKVQAVSPSGAGEFSNIASNMMIPATPTDVSATVNSATQVTVAWTASVNATGYIVKYGLSDGADTYTVPSKSTSVAITNQLTQGTEWFFKVYATANGVESAGSASTKVTTPINAPTAFEMTNTNDGMSLTGGASAASCPSGTTKYFSWKANNTNWVQGTNYMNATYPLAFGQSVTLQPSVRCQKGSVVSAYTQAGNSATYTRVGMDLKITPGEDDCRKDYCGRTINASWKNICGTTEPTIKAKQLGSTASWKASSASSDTIKWKGASSPGVRVSYYDVNIGCTSSAATINVISAYKCTGCN